MRAASARLAGLVEPQAGFDQGLDQRLQGLRIVRRPRLGGAQHLLRHALPDVGTGERDAADAERFGLLVPGLADAVAVDHAAREIGDGVRRRHNGEADVAIGIEAGRRQPEPQHVVLHRVGKHRGQHQRLGAIGRPLGDHGGDGARVERRAAVADQLGRRLFHLLPQALRQGERVAVHLQGHGVDHRHADAVDAQRQRERQRRQDVRGVELAQRQLVAHVGPRHFAADLDFESLALIGAQLLGQHDRRAVDDRDEPDLDLRSLQIGHAVRTPQTKTASRSAGRVPTAQDAVVQTTDRLWPVFNSGESPPLGSAFRWSMKHARHAEMHLSH